MSLPIEQELVPAHLHRQADRNAATRE
jgi:hypothetical protein